MKRIISRLEFRNYRYERRKKKKLIYEKVKELCEENGITIFALEKECGLSNGTIRKWEKASPTLKNIEKVASYFGKPLDDFSEGNEKEEKIS